MNALAAANFYRSDALSGLKRLVYTNGDSDSLAAIGGSFMGARYGYDALGTDFIGSLEPRYKYELGLVVDWFAEINNI